MALLLCTLFWFEPVGTYTTIVDRPEMLLALLGWVRAGAEVACVPLPVEAEEAVSTGSVAA